MSDRTSTEPAGCQHEFVATAIHDSGFARLCRWCGVMEPCTDKELHRFLQLCEETRTEYNWERLKAKSKQSEKAFAHGVELKDEQIRWLQQAIKDRKEK